jgi:hypothetical protein
MEQHMKLVIRVAILAAVTSISSAASAATTSGVFNFDWAGMTITSLFGAPATTSPSTPQFTGLAYNLGSATDSKSGATQLTVDIGTATGTINSSGLSIAATNGSVELSSSFFKTINVTGTALYDVILPYSYSFTASALPGGGTAGMNGELQLASYATLQDGSYQSNMTSLFANQGSFAVDSAGIQSRSGSGLLELLVGASSKTTSIYIGATAKLNGGAYAPMAPVPEPESYAMLLAGLGLMGAIAMRRKA